MNLFALDPKVHQIKQMAIFRGASRRCLAALAAQMDQIDVAAGSVLIKEGRPGHAFYIVLDGEAVARRGGRLVNRFGPGDFFGEISMIDRDPSVATVTATAPCSLLVMGHDQFRRALQADPDLEVAVTLAMQQRLGSLPAAALHRRSVTAGA